MIGIPPLAGFWAKIGVLESLLQLNTWLSNFLILIIILTTAFTTIGYLRIIKLFFIKNVYNINLNKIGLYSNFIYLQIYFCIFFLIFFPIIWNILLQFFDFNEFYLFIFF
jgi:NADH:ubiquinone oxidoreductase subunit 2 (subunit N)